MTYWPQRPGSPVPRDRGCRLWLREGCRPGRFRRLLCRSLPQPSRLRVRAEPPSGGDSHPMTALLAAGPRRTLRPGLVGSLRGVAPKLGDRPKGSSSSGRKRRRAMGHAPDGSFFPILGLARSKGSPLQLSIGRLRSVRFGPEVGGEALCFGRRGKPGFARLSAGPSPKRARNAKAPRANGERFEPDIIFLATSALTERWLGLPGGLC